MIQAGQVFINKEAARIHSHRWVIVSDPRRNPDKILIVNFTSNHSDPTCIVTPDEYPSLDHDSCVRYAETRCVTSKGIETLLSSGMCSSSKIVSPEVLQRIRDGFAISRHVRLEYRDLLRKQGLIA